MSESAPATAAKTEVFSRTINTKYHEGPVTFTRDQNVIVFTRNNASKGKTGKSSDGVKKLKLYSAINQGHNHPKIVAAAKKMMTA